jgi:hypothetical protein
MRVSERAFISSLVVLTIGFSAAAARAQEPGHAYAMGSLGYGLLVDDEGGLGAGVALGGGAAAGGSPIALPSRSRRSNCITSKPDR